MIWARGFGWAIRSSRVGTEGDVEALTGLGIFFAGLGVFFAGCGVLWYISLWKERNPRP